MIEIQAAAVEFYITLAVDFFPIIRNINPYYGNCDQ